MHQSQIRGMKLAHLVYLGTFLWTAVLSAGLIAFLVDYSAKVTDRALDRAIVVRAQSAGLDLARAIDAEWQELEHVAAHLRTDDPATMRGVFDGMVSDGNRVAWVGYVENNGKVATASGGMLEGADASARPWFRAGLKAAYAGDARDAVLINTLLGGTEADPVRLIDLAVPVVDGSGTPVGVLAAHIKVSWVQSYLRESARIRGIDLFLVNAAGDMVVSTAPPPERPDDLQTFRAASTAVSVSIREVWPDGRVYQSSVIPSVQYGALPSFGWRLVGRIPAEAFASDRNDLLSVALRIMLAGFSLTLVAAVVFVRLFVAPLRRLADTATAISTGEDAYPPETGSSREAAALSVALTRIQSRLTGRKAP